MRKFLQIFFLVFFSIIISFYLVEIFLFLNQSEIKKNLVSVHETRVKKAQLLKHEIDTRTPNEFYNFILNEKKINLKKGYIYNKIFFGLDVIQDYKKKKKPIPFRGPYNSFTFSYNELLNYALIENDRYGFKNPNIIYSKNIDIALFGDSYAEGYGLSNKFDISGVLRSKKINAANFGIAGAGPILTYATIKEYIETLKPKTVVYLYCEANDLTDLNFEKKDDYLNKYLNINYKQGLSQRLKENIFFYNEFLNEIGFNFESNNKIKKSTKTEFLKDILELSNIKAVIRNTYYVFFYKKNDLDQFLKIVENMQKVSIEHGSDFVFVYLPTWSRYFAKNTKYSKYISLKEDILDLLSKKNIKYIDIDNIFKKRQKSDLERLFPLNFWGHYSIEGYSVVADSIAKFNNLK